MDVTKQRISRTLEPKEMLLSFQAVFNLVNSSVVCAALESISGLESMSVITEPRYLKLVTVLSLWPVTLIKPPCCCRWPSFFRQRGLLCHQRGLLGTDFHAVGCGRFVETLN